MLRAVITATLLIIFSLLLGCPPPHGGASGEHYEVGQEQKGNIPLTIVNRTKTTIDKFTMYDDTGGSGSASIQNFASMVFDRPGSPSPAIKPGETRTFNVKPGKKSIEMADHPSNMSRPRAKVLESYKLDITGPTQIILWDTDPAPTDAAPAGVNQLVVLAYDEAKAREQASFEQRQQARADSNLDKCQKAVPPKSEKPAPGKTKADGKWTCILGGQATGTDYVSLVQLADGGITATITGTDRNVTWEGGVVADEVHFRFAGQEASGGKLKMDPGGRAMKGNGWTFTRRGECLAWTMTCTK